MVGWICEDADETSSQENFQFLTYLTPQLQHVEDDLIVRYLPWK